jgi:phage tail-like protein
MTSHNPRAFLFATPQQWQSCLTLGVDDQANRLMTWSGISDASAFERSLAVNIALAFPCEYFLWREADGQIWRKTCSTETADVVEGLHPLHSAQGVCIVGDLIWTWAKSSVALVDARSLAVTWRLTIAGDVVALTVDQHGLAIALVDNDDRQQLVIISSGGDVMTCFALPADRKVKHIVWARTNVVLVLTFEGDALLELDVQQRAVIRRISLSTFALCNIGIALSRSDKGPIILLVEHTQERAKYCIFLDGNSVKLGVVSMPEDTTAVFPSNEKLAIAAGRKIVTYGFTPAGKPSSIETRAVIVTPPLSIPQRSDEEGWRRMEIEANLPDGTRLEVAVAQISGNDALKSINNSWQAASATNGVAGEFLTATDMVDIADFQGDSASGQTRYSLQLPYATSATLVFKLTLHSSLNAPAPVISSMQVVYGGRSMASRLPAVMLRDDTKMGGFLSSLMGMLDAAASDIDQAILSLDSKSDVQRAEDTWLDEMAGWIGLPWHKRIPMETKRVMLQVAPSILQSYGARRGLQQVLNAALGDLEVDYNILDFTADLDIATTAGGPASASKLPMLLTGYPATAAMLGRKAIIGKAELLSANDGPECGDLGSVVLVEITTTASIKDNLSIWLQQVLKQMVPAHVELRIRWTSQKTIPGDMEVHEPHTVSQSFLNKDSRLLPRHTPHLNPLSHTECLS